MNETSNAAAVPPTSLEDTATPNLKVVSLPPRRRRSPSVLNRRQERDLAMAQQLCEAAKLPEYAPVMVTHKITSEFIRDLEADVRLARQRSEAALQCTNASQGYTADEEAAKGELLSSLRGIQSAARNEFRLTAPVKLQNYLVGENISTSRPALEAAAQTIIDAASSDRPGNVNTEVIVRTHDQRAAYVTASALQKSEWGRAKQERALRDELIGSIRARRKKIQYAADTAWPYSRVTSARARVVFQLPSRRPYSY